MSNNIRRRIISIQWLKSNVRFRWKADVWNIQLECLLNTESGRSGISNDRQLTTPSGRSVLTQTSASDCVTTQLQATFSI